MPKPLNTHHFQYETLNMFIFDVPDSTVFYCILKIGIHVREIKYSHLMVAAIYFEIAIIETDMQHIN